MNVRCSFGLMAGAVVLGGVAVLGMPMASVAKVGSIALGMFGILSFVNQKMLVRDHPLARVICWIHSLALECVALLGAICLKPFCYFSARRVAYPKEMETPILLVHGYLHDASAWVYQKKKLAKAGFGPVYAMNLRHPFSSIERLAQQVREKAAQIEKITGRSDLILIGHSMGGLVSSWYATQLAPQGKVKDVITIGSPFFGTHLAKIGIGSNAKEMQRGSPFLNDLQEAMSRKSEMRFSHIASSTDEVIIPADSAILPGASRTLMLDDVGHVALLYSPRVFQQIREWIS